MNDRTRRAGWLLLAAALAAADLWTKGLWEYPNQIPHGRPVLNRSVFEGWLDIRTIWNPGGVWSLDVASSILLWGTALAVPLVIIWMLAPAHSRRWESAAKALILGGAIGNLYDRWRWNAVRDWIDVYFGDIAGWHWPTFNVADMALVGGIGVLLVLSFVQEREAKAAKRSAAQANGEATA
ncbi:MAG: signal peptidase II [Planctomycetota bacterium]|jgi:signal peptidase II